MMCIAAGSLQMMRDKEVELVKQGYQVVAGPEILPMQYTVTPEFRQGRVDVQAVMERTSQAIVAL